MEDLLVQLGRLRYPATRQDLIDAAVTGHAESATAARLESLADRTYMDADDVSFDLFGHRAESNPSVVAITAEPCERCGFPRTAGESHSCVEQKALFSEAANDVTDTFARFDETTARQAASEDLRSGSDRRHGGTQIAHSDERRHPKPRGDGWAGAAVDNGGQRREPRRDAR
jgi:hypothetical protein